MYCNNKHMLTKNDDGINTHYNNKCMLIEISDDMSTGCNNTHMLIEIADGYFGPKNILMLLLFSIDLCAF